MKEPKTFPSDEKVVAIVQARLGSIRFPGKVLAAVAGVPLLQTMLNRLRRATTLSEIVLAIPDNPDNDSLAQFAETEGLLCFRGSEHDVLQRFAEAAEFFGASIVVRLTADCPLIDPELVDLCVEPILEGSFQHTMTSGKFPDGLDVEVFTFDLLDRANREATDGYDREHVTPYIRRANDINSLIVDPPIPLVDVRLTLDEREDYTVISNVLSFFPDDFFSFSEIDVIARSQPQLFTANKHLARNSGGSMNSGQKMWRRAQKVIAGGTMLLSKRPDLHSPSRWPTYFSRAKGCRVWDLDGKEYLDFGFMGVGTNILGYGNEAVDNAVRRAVDDGNLSTLNAPEEVLLAEKLVDLHPWADMARFTRSGGEAGAVAVRLARAATGREKIAFCGYHGWHDWYLAANLGDENALDDHLLPGLKSAGVPRGLAGSAVPFAYNDADSLRAVLSSGDVAAIYMEVQRNIEPAPGFLEEVRSLADESGAVLIFDECTSGFRRNLGGLHLHYGVNPDVVVLGKTVGNGYAINAVVGIEPVMKVAWETFVSSTFWTERIGVVAALATLEEMSKHNAPARIHEIGLEIRRIWSNQAADCGFALRVEGLPALSTFSIQDLPPLVLKTALTRLFLDRGVLGGPTTYAAMPHEELLEGTFSPLLRDVLEDLRGQLDSGRLDELVGGKLVSSGFSRMN